MANVASPIISSRADQRGFASDAIAKVTKYDEPSGRRDEGDAERGH